MAQRRSSKLAGEALWEFAVRAIGARAHSAGELREKLRRKAESLTEVEEVLRRLKRSGYLDDRRFAEAYAEARKSGQGLGAARVLRDLRARRVAPAVAEQAVRRAYQGADELELIRRFLERKYRSVDLKDYLQEQRNLAAAYRRLRLAGFGPGNVLRVLREYSQAAESFEEEDLPPEVEP